MAYITWLTILLSGGKLFYSLLCSTLALSCVLFNRSSKLEACLEEVEPMAWKLQLTREGGTLPTNLQVAVTIRIQVNV